MAPLLASVPQTTPNEEKIRCLVFAIHCCWWDVPKTWFILFWCSQPIIFLFVLVTRAVCHVRVPRSSRGAISESNYCPHRFSTLTLSICRLWGSKLFELKERRRRRRRREKDERASERANSIYWLPVSKCGWELGLRFEAQLQEEERSLAKKVVKISGCDWDKEKKSRLKNAPNQNTEDREAIGLLLPVVVLIYMKHLPSQRYLAFCGPKPILVLDSELLRFPESLDSSAIYKVSAN